MFFTPAQFERFAHGVLEHTYEGRAWQPHRIAGPMRGLYEPSPGLLRRMNCPAGVRLRFRSDTRRIALRMACSEGYRNPFLGALLVDGQLFRSFGPGQQVGDWAGVVFEQDRAARNVMRDFDLHLPYGCTCLISDLEIDDGCRLEPAPPLGRKWLVLGDSIVQGAAASGPTTSAVARCTLALGLDTRNLAVGSATLDPRLAQTVPDVPFDIASIAYGLNDFAHDIPADAVAQSAARLIETLLRRQPAAVIFLLTPTPSLMHDHQTNKIGLTPEDYRAALRPVAASQWRVNLVEGTDLIEARRDLMPDEVHPNDAGFALYANHLMSCLAKG